MPNQTALSRAASEQQKIDKYSMQLFTWNAWAKCPPMGEKATKSFAVPAGLDIYVCAVQRCPNSGEFEEWFRTILRDPLNLRSSRGTTYACYEKYMGKSPSITLLMVFVKMDLAVSGRWQILQKSDKSSKWEVPRGPKSLFGRRTATRRDAGPLMKGQTGLHSL